MSGYLLEYFQQLPPFAPIPKACEAAGDISVPKLYQLAGEGRIRFVKMGSKTLVDMVSVRDYLASLPSARITTKTPRRRKQKNATNVAEATSP